MMRFFWIPVLALLVFSCFEQGDCSDVSSNVMQVNFYKFSDKKKLALELDSVKMIGLDTVMHADTTLSMVKLPLDFAVNKMTYIFYSGTDRDTLEIQYDLSTYALAPDCNAIDLINLKMGVSNSIQEITIAQPKITNPLKI